MILLPGGAVSRLGGGLLLSVAAAVPWWDRPERRALIAELLGCLLAGIVLGGAAWGLDLPGEAARAAGFLGAITLALVWCWSLPLRALGWPALGRLTGLAVFSLAAATPFLLVESPAILPSWVTAWNPLARLAGSVLEHDWFHGPLLYGRVGEAWYRYPSGFEGMLVPFASGGAALILGFGLGRVRSAERGRNAMGAME